MDSFKQYFQTFKQAFFKSVNKISGFFDTPYFALALAILELFCYYLGLDLLMIGIVSFCLTFSFLAKKELNCLMVIVMFLTSVVSLKNSPGNLEVFCDYYFQVPVIVFCIIAAVIPCLSAAYRAIKNIIQKRYGNKMLLISSLTLGFCFLINGIFSSSYIFLDLLFGTFLMFFFVILYFAVLPDVKINKETMTVISKQIAFYLAVPLIELIVFYIGFFAGGNKIDMRLFIFLGWGNRNTLGMVLSICLCFVFFLIANEKNTKIKIAWFALCILTLVGIVMSFSRQAYLVAAIGLGIYLVVNLIRTTGKDRIKNVAFLFTYVTCLILVIAFTLSLEDYGKFNLETIRDIGDGRFQLWEKALKAFTDSPIFGSGFYFIGGDPKVNLDNVMPFCCHNTIFQMLGSCGIIGLGAYVFYRTCTVKEIIKNYTAEKKYAIFALGMFLLMSLLDIHIFDLLGTCIYVMLLAICTSSKCEEKEVKEIESKVDIENEVEI